MGYQTHSAVDVLVVGGGCSGAMAALQAASMGAKVCLFEESLWFGGMVSAAGVSCLDGNEGALGGGLFGTFRAAMEEHYGGADKVRTGWVSNTCFDPRVAARWFADRLLAAKVQVVQQVDLKEVLREEDRIVGAVFTSGDQTFEVRAKVTIEATEYGDVLGQGGVPFRLGRESRMQTGEAHAPAEPDHEIQDLTMVATLRKVEGGAKRVPLPKGFDTKRFHSSTAVHAANMDPEHLNHKLHTWEAFLSYGRLPGGDFMLNWPFHCNDYPAQGLFGTPGERATTIAAAKERTLAYVHYIQTELGHPEWGIAEDIYPSADGLALIPYVRESRRIVPVRWLREEDVVPEEGMERNAVHPDGVAVGDYYLDHHHSKDHRPAGERLGEDYPSNAPFQIPYSCMVPREVDGLIAAEKSIGATHIVNGCSRLQPVAMLIGQAAGAAAALAVKAKCEPRAVNVKQLQETLLAAGAQIVPDRSCPNTDPNFAERQRLLLGD